MRAMGVIFCVVVGSTLLIIGGLAFVKYGPKPAFSVTPAKPLPSRQAVQDLVHTSSDNLVALLGRPDRTATGYGEGKSNWYYHNATVDPVSGRVDDLLVVEIFAGRVWEVRFR